MTTLIAYSPLLQSSYIIKMPYKDFYITLISEKLQMKLHLEDFMELVEVLYIQVLGEL